MQKNFLEFINIVNNRFIVRMCVKYLCDTSLYQIILSQAQTLHSVV